MKIKIKSRLSQFSKAFEGGDEYLISVEIFRTLFRYVQLLHPRYCVRGVFYAFHRHHHKHQL